MNKRGTMTLERWIKEKATQHRALLLLAMQDPGSNPQGMSMCDGRNLQLVIRTIARSGGTKSQSTIKNWRTRYSWDDRIAAHGPDAQRTAIDLYRLLYFREWGSRDLPTLAHVISQPMSAPDAMATAVQEEARKLLTDMKALEPPEETKRRVEDAMSKHREAAKKSNGDLRQITRGVMLAITQAVKAATDKDFAKANPHIAPLQVRASDLPRIHKMIKQLEEEWQRLDNPEISQLVDGGTRHVDSVRVKIAKQQGVSIWPAVRADCLEMIAVIEELEAPELTVADLVHEDRAGDG